MKSTTPSALLPAALVFAIGRLGAGTVEAAEVVWDGCGVSHDRTTIWFGSGASITTGSVAEEDMEPIYNRWMQYLQLELMD